MSANKGLVLLVLILAALAIASLWRCCHCPGGETQPQPNTLTLYDLPHNDLPHNSVSETALCRNQHLRQELATIPLGQLNRLSSGAQTEAGTSESHDLLKYVVSCALDAGTSVHLPGSSVRYDGELGLCGRTSPYGNWHAAPPSPRCLQVVSSCVLSRVNALGKRVVLSMRGQPPLALQPAVPVETEFREAGGTPIPSLAACATTGAPYPNQDCGWKALYVGRCDAGSSVTLTAGNSASPPPVMMRVCSGLYGCSHQECPTPVDLTTHPECKYATTITSVAGATVTFTCPANGPYAGGARKGYYSVLLASANAASLSAATYQVRASAGDYPATEQDVFTFREGAFYGDVFGACASAPPQPLELGGKRYACYDGTVWSDGAAHLADRLCGGPTASLPPGGCFGNTPLACYAAADDRCASATGPNGSYTDCYATNPAAPPQPPKWGLPVTIYLNHPCDLSVEDGACLKQLNPDLAGQLLQQGKGQ